MNVKKIVFYLVILIISFFLFTSYTPKKDIQLDIEVITFPPKEYLDDLEILQIQ